MKKILVVGPSGAGKTVLAKNIADVLAISHTELDSINHQKNWKPLDKLEFKNRVALITDGPEWIICGNYFKTLGGVEYWAQADTIIWCDYSFLLDFSRLLKRTLRRTITRQELWNGNREGFIMNFFTADSVFLWMMREWRAQKREYQVIFNDKKIDGVDFVRLRSPKDARELIESLRLIREK